MSPGARVIVGDCCRVLPEMEQRAHCCVTSPPYLWLRDYEVAPSDWPEVSYAPQIGLPHVLVPAQSAALGLERDPWAYVGHLVHVFRQLRGALRDDATLWLNLGDTSASGGRGGGGSFMQERGDASWKAKGAVRGFRRQPPGYREKDVLGMPWRCALALQADGWVLRSEVIWEKPNAMPESAEDRPTRCHEHVFLLARRSSYFYDGDAIREPVTGGAHTRGGGVGSKAVPPGRGMQGRIRQNARFGFAVRELVTSRNKRTVWSIATESYRGQHYATFPRELARACVSAGTSAAGCCALCGAPMRRQVEIVDAADEPNATGLVQSHGVVAKMRRTTGWAPSCRCEADVVPCTVIDPFAGSGTVGVAAIELGRSFVGIDASEGYAEMARERLARTRETLGVAGSDDAARLTGPTQLGLLRSV